MRPALALILLGSAACFLPSKPALQQEPPHTFLVSCASWAVNAPEGYGKATLKPRPGIDKFVYVGCDTPPATLREAVRRYRVQCGPWRFSNVKIDGVRVPPQTVICQEVK